MSSALGWKGRAWMTATHMTQSFHQYDFVILDDWQACMNAQERNGE